MKYFSMFTGIGGFELGIGDLGQCIGFCETDKWASQLLSNRFPTIKNYGDARTCDFQSLDSFDLLVGGFPCQAFSIAGNRRGFEDTRGTLFFSIAEALRIKRPKLVLLENVKGLLNHDKGKTFAVILQTLEELGYDTQWMVLNSKFFGVPQNRERVFIIGSLRAKHKPEILPFSSNSREAVEQSKISSTLLSGYPKNGGGNTYIKYFNQSTRQHDRIYETDGISPTLAGASKLSGDCTPKIVSSRGRNPNNLSERKVGMPTEQFLEVNKEGTTNTLTSVQKDNMVFDGRIRRLTPTECERLQGFPDGWTEGFSDTQRYKLLGNAVTVNVIRAIAHKMFPKE